MKNVKVVIGSMYGDEGKGFTTNLLCSKMQSDVLNIKFNGTAQAGHTVDRNGVRHVFKTFGAGTMNDHTYTLLSSTFVLEPIMLNIEAKSLSILFNKNLEDVFNRLCIDENCKIILPWDRLINEKKERERVLTNSNHGSCGYGLYESILREGNYKTVTVGDLYKMSYDELYSELKDIQNSDYYNSQLDYVYGDELIFNFMEDLINIFMHCNIVDEVKLFKEFNSIVFEGGQGLMLDWDRDEFMPHLTASKTSTSNIYNLLNKINEDMSIEIVYVTRTYHTRHGKGYMNYEVESYTELGYDLYDETNTPNEFQETLRYGYFDCHSFINNINNDYSDFLNNIKNNHNVRKSIMITHAKKTDNKILMKNNYVDIMEFCDIIKSNNNIDNIYVDGEVLNDRENSV